MDNQQNSTNISAKSSANNETPSKGNNRSKRGQKTKNQNQQPQSTQPQPPVVDEQKLPSEKESLSAVKVTDNSIPAKTPVSVLQELLSRRGITPSYELVQIEGAIHEPTFRYRVSYNDKEVPYTAMGAGRSKKEAKHAAAKALIDKMSGNLTGDSQNNLILNAPNASTEEAIANGDDNATGNPIGLLQELCMSKHWPPPTYITQLEMGLPHERQFTISCAVVKQIEVGQGKSKKIAKRIAAQKMYNYLDDNPPNKEEVNQSFHEEGNEEMEQRVTNILGRYKDLKDANIPALTNQHSYKVSQFHKTMKANPGEKLTKLQLACLNDETLNHVQFLQDIALEHHFEVTYVDIDEKTYAGNYQFLVQLSTLPVAVCHGSGRSLITAQSNAARNALEYLKIMTKK